VWSVFAFTSSFDGTSPLIIPHALSIFSSLEGGHRRPMICLRQGGETLCHNMNEHITVLFSRTEYSSSSHEGTIT